MHYISDNRVALCTVCTFIVFVTNIFKIIIFQGGDMDSCNYKALTSRQYSVKRLSEKFNVVSMKDTFRSSENVFIENEAFQELKDDDL